MDRIEEMKKFLTKNNRENIDLYINGYYTASEIAEETNCLREDFYYVAKKIDPQVIEKRENNKQRIYNDIVKQIKNVVPYEYLVFDPKALFGAYKGEDYKPSRYNKQIIRGFIRYADDSLEDIEFVSQKAIKLWYQYHLIEKEMKNNLEIKPREILGKYNISRSTFERIRRHIKTNQDVPYIKASETQRKLFYRNIKIFESYKERSLDVEELAKKYGIEKYIVNSIIKSFLEIEENICNQEA